MTLNTSPLGVIYPDVFIPFGSNLSRMSINEHTQFEELFQRYDWCPQTFLVSHVTLTTPISGVVCQSWVRISMINLSTKSDISISTHYKDTCSNHTRL